MTAEGPRPRCGTPRGDVRSDGAAIERIEDAYRSWYEVHAGVPGVEVRSSDQLTWMCGPGVGWSSAAVRLRLRPGEADARLGAAFAHAFARGRGFGVWVSDLARPADLDARLARLRFRKRKRFPGMLADLTRLPSPARGAGLEIREVDDEALFARRAHPYFGPITTDIRRFEMSRLAHLAELRPKRVFNLVAFEAKVPVGAATLFVGGPTAAFFDVGVLESVRNRGIGTELMRAGCAFARDRGAEAAILLSSGMGYRVYERVGFREVCRVAYWYSKGSATCRASRA